MLSTRIRRLLTVASPLALAMGLSAAAIAQEKVTFVDHVQPLFRQKCAACHNPDKKSGGLDLTNYTNMMLGGSSGDVIAPGDAETSYLYLLVTHQDSPKMPPESEKLPEAQLNVIRDWINGGALETKNSKAVMSDKPKLDLALGDTPSGRPEKPAVPLRMALDPVFYTSRTTAVTSMATSPWAPVAAVGSQKQVVLYDTRNGAFLGALPFPEGVPQVLKFSRNGSLLLAGGGHDGLSGKVVVWNVETGERVIEVGDELDTVLAADISADQSRIALGGPQRVVRIYSTATGELLHELRKHTDWIYSLEFSPDGVLLASGDRNGGAFVWEAFTGREYLVLKGHTAGVTGISWRSDSNIVASGSEDTTIRLWELENGGEVKRWTAHGGGVSHIEFARDGRILSAGRDKTAKLWDQTGKQLQQFEAFSDIALRVTFCDESNRAIAGDWKGEVRIWKADDGARVGTLSMNPAPVAQRIAAAQTAVKAATDKHTPLAAAVAAADAAAKQATAAHTAAAQTLATTDAAMKTAVQNADTIAKEHAKLAGEHQAMAGAMDKLSKATPMLAQSAATAKAAAAAAPDDKELEQLAQQLDALNAKRGGAELAELKKQVEAKVAAVTAAKAKLDAAEAAKAQAAAALKAAQENLPKTEAAMKQAAEKLAAAQAAATPVAAELAGAQQALAQWQEEAQFANQLSEMQGKLKASQEQYTAALETVDSRTAVVNDMANAATATKQQADAAQATMTKLAEQMKQMEAKLKAAQDAVVANKAKLDTMAATATALTKAVAPLEQAAAKTNEASTMVADDKLKEAAVTLKTLLDQKKAELDSANKEVAAMQAAEKTLATAVAAETQAVSTTKASMDAAAKDLEVKAAAYNAANAKVVEAQKSLAEVSDAAAKMQAETEQLKQQILAFRSKPRPTENAQAAK